MLVSDFVKQLIIKDPGFAVLEPSITTLRLMKTLEHILDKERINQTIDECIDAIQQSSIQDIDTLDFALEFVLLKIPNDFPDQISSFIQELNFDSKIIDPLLLSRIALCAQIMNDDTIIDRVSKYLGKKRRGRILAEPFHNLVKSIIQTQDEVARIKEIDKSISTIMEKQHLDDEFLHLYSICIFNNLIDVSADSRLMNELIRNIENELAGRITRCISANQHSSENSGILNLLLVLDIVDSETRRICLPWMKDFDLDGVDCLNNLLTDQSNFMLDVSNYLFHSSTLLNLIKEDKNLILSYWIGAALILLEVGVTQSIRKIDETLYNTLKRKNAKFDEKLEEFEKISLASVKGVLTRNFYRIRNSVVHHEMDLTIFDLEQICHTISEYLKRIL